LPPSRVAATKNPVKDHASADRYIKELISFSISSETDQP